MRQSARRIQALMTGNQGKMGPAEAHERNVLAITRRIHTLTMKRAKLRQQADACTKELRASRRELRAVLQRDSSITEEDNRLHLAGRADAIDGNNQ